MAKKGKKFEAVRSKVDRSQKYGFTDGVSLTLETAYAKFDESLDVAVRLGVNPRHADQMVRGAVVLPHGVGKKVRVLVFAKGEKEKEAMDAGADYVGAEDLIEKIKGGWLDFDKAVATPDLMGQVGKIGKILGPRGLMPNVKAGSVTFDVAKVVHAPMGKVSFGPEKLLHNLASFFDSLIRLKPTSSKGTYVQGIALSTTMGPGVRIDPLDVKNLLRIASA